MLKWPWPFLLSVLVIWWCIYKTYYFPWGFFLLFLFFLFFIVFFFFQNIHTAFFQIVILNTSLIYTISKVFHFQIYQHNKYHHNTLWVGNFSVKHHLDIHYIIPKPFQVQPPVALARSDQMILGIRYSLCIRLRINYAEGEGKAHC